MSASLQTTAVISPAASKVVNLRANAVNATFQNSPSNYLTLQERYDNYFSSHQAALKQVVEHWTRNNSAIKQWGDLQLCRAVPAKLSDILIDTTLQRELYVRWVMRILQNFKSLQVRPISVYQDANQPKANQFTAWDGQHTAMALYIIAVEMLGLDPQNCEVPVVVYNSKLRSQMRDSFIVLNSDLGSQEMSKAELFRQTVLKVRCDGSKDPDHLQAEAKQVFFETYGLFVCDELSQNASFPGAITNMSEILATGSKYTMSDLENFCKLFALATNSSRPVQSKEMWQFMDYFRLCRQTGITVDDNYVDQMATDLTSMFRVFNGERIHNKGKYAYQDWFRHHRPGCNGYLWEQTWNNSGVKNTHLIWLTMVLRAHSSVKVPTPQQSWNNFPAPYLSLTYLQQ